jgi:hypothetical protein
MCGAFALPRGTGQFGFTFFMRNKKSRAITDVIRHGRPAGFRLSWGVFAMKGSFNTVVLVPLLLVAACNASQVSGTYVAHSQTFTEMLQLTQTPDGQISGVLSYVG